MQSYELGLLRARRRIARGASNVGGVGLLLLAACGSTARDGNATKSSGATNVSGASGGGSPSVGDRSTAGASNAASAGGTSGAPNVASNGGASSPGGAPGSAGGVPMTMSAGGANVAGSGVALGGMGGSPTGAGGAVAASGAGGGAPLGALTVSNLMIAPNPKMTLSCYVSWTTSEAANSEVDFGMGGYQFRVVDPTSTTDHKVHVVGMHPQTAYQIKAVSTSATATGSAEGTFTTGMVPANLPSAANVITNERDKMQPGWTLTNYQVGGAGSSNTSTQPGIIVIVDEDGIPVWYYVHGTTADQYGMTSTDFLPNGHVLVGNASAEPAVEVDLEGNIVWTGPTGGTPAASHHTGKLMNGDYAIVRESNATARVEELNPQDQVVWTWDLYDYIKPKTSANDWCHLNSVTFDEVNDFLYFNCRFQGLFKVNRADKSIIWQMGAAIDDPTTGDITYLPDNSARFNDSHDPEIHSDGTILFYDNQGWMSHDNGQGNGSYHTRVVEYQLDEPNKTATLEWEFPGSFDVDSWYENDWSTPIWGDADRLSNGDVLVTAGARGAGTHTRIFEVTRAGEVVWAIEWPENNGSYRADRIEQPPVEKLP